MFTKKKYMVLNGYNFLKSYYMYLFTFHTILFWLQYSLDCDGWISDDTLQNFTRNGFDNLLDLLIHSSNRSRIFSSWFHLSYNLKDKKYKGFRSGDFREIRKRAIFLRTIRNRLTFLSQPLTRYFFSRNDLNHTSNKNVKHNFSIGLK